MGFFEIEVWLQVGREGRSFTYCDSKGLSIDLGDIVAVTLRGRQMNGLVVGKRIREDPLSGKRCKDQEKNRSLTEVEEIVQKAAVDQEWQDWLEESASKCYTSSFRMLKAALPPGWLGYRKSANKKLKRLLWVSINPSFDCQQNLPSKQQGVIALIKTKGGGIWQKDLLANGVTLGVLRSCLSIGAVLREKRTIQKTNDRFRKDKGFLVNEQEKPRNLTDEQKLAIDCFSKQSPGTALLLWGVTGSGKTEVYLQIASQELTKGRHCLILAPEIGLIPQLVDRFVRRFGSQVLEYHSGCSENERISTWRKILTTSEPTIVVGTRSAVFLPLSPLGLIVLDEEHDSSYKQESPMPCYHARDLALDRAKRTGARIILGSATPSLSTWKELQPAGSIAVARLSSRIANQPLPLVHVVDMRQELSEGNRRLISKPLMKRLSLLPELKEQAVVLVPRRGYNTFLSCRSCGDVVQCPNCDVSLTVHKGQQGSQWLRCHWCDHRANIGFRCNECGSSAFKPFGAGTQRVVEHLSNELSHLKLLRFDRDTTGGRDGHRRLLQRFSSGEADVLIGTQMLAKGMDIPRVTLAVVLAADGLLHRPDLFAEEQSLQLFMQLAGRAGRGDKPGKVFVQTYSPDHPVIKHLVDGCYEDFLGKEAKLRSEAGLVPYSRACLLRLSGERASVTATSATALAEYIEPLCKAKGWTIIGPAPALVEKIAGKSRWQILLHGPEGAPLPLPQGNKLWECLPKGVNLSVDPDPINL
ncbi:MULTISPECIES: replication restart helicase PriA [Prochlorococcus]|uniref:replication restart helicase PriA n=1 Tax=Prochlorococcus TaxID=1218 RepID=UPI000533A88D|nr:MULTISPECIES: primosomal protein N' [Prochlorococcus]KGG12894.1 Helicase PriA essential for oriC/DnaA-independent DNA replication [Prochlorococcus sp. MIT 0601]